MVKYKIKEARIKANMSQAGLAKIAGISTSYLSEIESSYKYPSLETLCKISKALKCPVEELFECKK